MEVDKIVKGKFDKKKQERRNEGNLFERRKESMQ